MKRVYKTFVVAVIALTLGITIGYFVGISATSASIPSITVEGNETFVTFHTTLNAFAGLPNEGATFVYPITINYSDSWSVHYWIENYTGMQNAVSGNLVGSGDSETWITVYVSGGGEYTLCASATRLPPNESQQFNPTLTLAVLVRNDSTTDTNPTVEVCGTLGV